MFIKEDPAERRARAGVLAAANLAIAGALVYRCLTAPVLGFVTLSAALMMIPEEG